MLNWQMGPRTYNPGVLLEDDVHGEAELEMQHLDGGGRDLRFGLEKVKAFVAAERVLVEGDTHVVENVFHGACNSDRNV